MDRYFEFDNVKSIDMDYHIVYFPQDYFERVTYGGRSIDTHNIEENKLEFTVMLSKMDSMNNLIPFDSKSINELSNWLIQETYKPLKFSYDIDKVYYAMVSEISPLNLDRANNGFVEVTFITNTSHAFTNPKIDEYSIVDEKEIEIESLQTIGGKYTYPFIEIIAREDTDVEIHNLGTNQKVQVKDLKQNDVVTINNENRIFKGVKFSQFNREWLKLRYGSNLIVVKGNINIRFKTQYGIL